MNNSSRTVVLFFLCRVLYAFIRSPLGLDFLVVVSHETPVHCGWLKPGPRRLSPHRIEGDRRVCVPSSVTRTFLACIYTPSLNHSVIALVVVFVVSNCLPVLCA